MLISSPSFVEVPIPSRNRTSSPLMYTFNKFVQITSTSKDEPTFANYAVFQGLSGSNQTVSYELLSPWMNAPGVAGIQIVDVSSVQVESETWGAIKTLYR